MYSLISIRVFTFSLIVVHKSNVDIDEKEITDNKKIMELEMDSNSMIIKIKNNKKSVVNLSKISDNDEIMVKGERYIVLHKIKF